MQISDQNRYWSTSRFGREAKPEEWQPWHWMRDSADPNVRLLWDRMRVTTRADCTDAGMAHFLMTGDEDAEISKLQALLEKTSLPQPALADSASYDIDARYAAQDSSSSELLLFVNGRATGHSWSAQGTPHEWQSHIIRQVEVKKGDSLKVSSNGPVGLD